MKCRDVACNVSTVHAMSLLEGGGAARRCVLIDLRDPDFARAENPNKALLCGAILNRG